MKQYYWFCVWLNSFWNVIRVHCKVWPAGRTFSLRDGAHVKYVPVRDSFCSSKEHLVHQQSGSLSTDMLWILLHVCPWPLLTPDQSRLVFPSETVPVDVSSAKKLDPKWLQRSLPAAYEWVSMGRVIISHSVACRKRSLCSMLEGGHFKVIMQRVKNSYVHSYIVMCTFLT